MHNMWWGQLLWFFGERVESSQAAAGIVRDITVVIHEGIGVMPQDIGVM